MSLVDRIAARTPERLSAADTAWLHLDAPTSPMTVTAALHFADPPSFTAVEEVIRSATAHVPRLRQRVRGPHLMPRWQDDPTFDLAEHVQRVSLPSPAGDAELAELISDALSRPLDLRRPLWAVDWVEHPRGATLIARLSHAIADGVGLLLLLESMTEPTAPAAPSKPSAPRRRPPLRSLQGAWVLTRLLLAPFDPESSLRGPLGTHKRAAAAPLFELDRVRAVAATTGASFNDVILAATAGALRTELSARHLLTPDLELHAVEPVDLRDDGSAHDLGNHFGLVFAPLPVRLAIPEDRLAYVKQHMARVKRSPEAALTLQMLRATGRAGTRLERAVVEAFGKKATVVLTNVRGPGRKVRLAGKPVDRIDVWVPQSGNLAIGVSVLTYAGRVSITVGADATSLPHPETLARGIVDELERLSRGTGRPSCA